MGLLKPKYMRRDESRRGKHECSRHVFRAILFHGRSQALFQVPEDVVQILKPDGQAHDVRSHAGSRLLACAELLMRRGSRVDHQASRITDVRQMRKQL